MTVSGQATVNYSYDSADRLTQISQGGMSITFSYDSEGRITAISRSNGIVIEYTYDTVSNLTSIIYKKEASVLGNPRDGATAPNPNQSELNNDTIYNNCYRGLSRLPSGVAQF